MKVLVVEFVKEIKEHYVSLLENEGFTVDATDNGKIGLELALKNQYQLIITNAALFELSGYTMIRNIRKQNIDCPILVLTARSRWQDQIMAYIAGADYYASTPLFEHEILSCIENVMTGRESDEIPVAREHMLKTDKTEWFVTDMNLITSEERKWLPEELENEWLNQETQRSARRETRIIIKNLTENNEYS